MPVLAEVREHERHMYPLGAGPAVLFPYQLVEGQMVADILEPLPAFLTVPVNAEVSGLPFHVLTVGNTADGFVQFLRSEAAANLDGFVHGLAQRLQDKCSQIDQIDHLLHARLVVDALRLGRFRGVQFFYREVHGDWCIHIYSSSQMNSPAIAV